MARRRSTADGGHRAGLIRRRARLGRGGRCDRRRLAARAAGRHVVRAPMADGGEGTLAAVAVGPRRRGGAAHACAPSDALGRPIEADWLLLDDGRGAFVEMAAASGLALLAPSERTPETATPGVAPAAPASCCAPRSTPAWSTSPWALAAARPPTAAAACWRPRRSGSSTRPETTWRPVAAALAGLDVIDAAGLDRGSREVRLRSPRTSPTRCAARWERPRPTARRRAPTRRRWTELDAALAIYGDAIEAATGRVVADLPGAGAAGGTTAGTARLHECHACGRGSRSWPRWSDWPRRWRAPTW